MICRINTLSTLFGKSHIPSFLFRLRQQHQKLIISLEQRQQQEMYEHRKALEREFENQMHTFDKEMEKLKTKHRQELEQKVSSFF